MNIYITLDVNMILITFTSST